MVERVHALRTHAFLYHVTVPTFPNRSGTIVDGVEPAWVLTLEKQFVGDVNHAVVCEGWHQDARAEKTGLQTVTMFGKVLAEASNETVLGFALHKLVLQNKECRCLHCVENGSLETSFPIKKLFFQVLLGTIDHLLISRSITSCCSSHVAHHRCVDGPVGGSEEFPIGDGVGQRTILAKGTSAPTLQRFVAEPVRPLVVVVLSNECLMVVSCTVDMLHKAVHCLPVLVDDTYVAKLLPHGPRHNHACICPAQSHHFART